MKKKVKNKKSFRIRLHKFVRALEATDNKPSQLRIIQGFVGKAAGKNQVRIYLDAEIRRFVDVSMNDIEHYEDQRTIAAPNASVLLWVSEKAEIKHYGHWIGAEDPTTMVPGAEGEVPTSLPAGEESFVLPYFLEPLINPFGSFNSIINKCS